MSRLFEQYSSEEKVDVLNFTINNQNKYISTLQDDVYLRDTKIAILKRVIDKLPVKEKKLTKKRYEKMMNEFMKSLNVEIEV